MRCNKTSYINRLVLYIEQFVYKLTIIQLSVYLSLAYIEASQ